jgi:transcription elongation factor GreA-like protein
MSGDRVNKKTKNKKLSKDEHLYNKDISKSRITNEHVIWYFKKIKILRTPYRDAVDSLAVSKLLPDFVTYPSLCEF